MWVLEGLISLCALKPTELFKVVQVLWSAGFAVRSLPFLIPTALLFPNSTSTLAGPSPRAVQPPEYRVQPLPVLAQLPMSTLLDLK